VFLYKRPLDLDVLRALYAALGLGLGGEELRENVGEDTTLRDDNVAEELVELLVVADGKLQVTGDDTRLLVVTGGVTGELEDLGSKVLEDSGEVDGGPGTDTLGVVAALEVTVDTTDGDWRRCKLKHAETEGLTYTGVRPWRNATTTWPRNPTCRQTCHRKTLLKR
jgi:hypothetical protein